MYMLLPNVDPDFSSRRPKPAGLRTSDARPAAPFGLHGVASDRGAQALEVPGVPLPPKKHGKFGKMCVTVELIERSLEVKLPTIWTDEKQSREEAERRERSEGKKMQMREKVGMSRTTVFFQ